MTMIMTGVANTGGSIASLNRFARCSGWTRRVKEPFTPIGIGFMAMLYRRRDRNGTLIPAICWPFGIRNCAGIVSTNHRHPEGIWTRDLSEAMMRKRLSVATVVGAGWLLAAAAHADPYNPGERALGGGLVGAGTGAVIGAIAGGGRGAGVGAAVGGGLGAVAGAATTPVRPPRSAYRHRYRHVRHYY